MSLVWMRPRLAELCGLKYEWVSDDSIEYFVGLDRWRPDKDVAQAIRCLDAWSEKVSGEWTINRRHVAGEPAYNVRLEPTCVEWTTIRRLLDGSMQRAICLAVAEAMGWEEPK
jgi:hypothetical protein